MKGRKHRDTGGTNEAAQDLSSKNMDYTAKSKVSGEAEEKKRGGKTVGKMHGGKAHMHAGRKPRKQGGGTYSDSNPYTSARRGETPPGRKVQTESPIE